MPAYVSTAFTAVLIYTVLWSLIVFMVLPFGVRPPDAPEPGHAHGAPQRARIVRKMVITSLVALPLTALVMWAIAQGLVPLREAIQ